MKILSKLAASRNKIKNYLSSVADGVEWLCEPKESEKKGRYVEFKPLRGGYFVEKYLFSGFEKVFLLSGTFLNVEAFSRDIGIRTWGTYYQQIPHPFPVQNRKIFFVQNLADMSFRNQQASLPKIVDYVEGLLKHYANKKGIIFTASYTLQTQLYSALVRKNPALATRLLSAETDSKESALATHTSSSAPTVLLTCSMWQGVDLKDDLSRFQIFIKVPYASLQDKRVARLAKEDPTWYKMQAALVLCQGYGRSIRSVSDFADTYILDSNFDRYLRSAGNVLPNWFTEAIQRVNI